MPASRFAFSSRSAITRASASAMPGCSTQRPLEIGALEHGARRRLDGDHARGARVAGDERHLAEHLPGAELGEQELDARVRVLVADGDQAADDQERGVAGAAFPDDGLLRREVAPPHPGFEVGGFGGDRPANRGRSLSTRPRV